MGPGQPDARARPDIPGLNADTWRISRAWRGLGFYTGSMAKTQPRKRPRQARSRVTVDAIVTATTQLLVSRGLDELTTAAVAERAGVSVGTLYQYFPNKQSLVAAVIEAELERDRQRLFAVFERGLEAPLVESIDGLGRVLIEVYGPKPLLYRHMVAVLDELELAEAVQAVVDECVAGFADVLRARAHEHRRPDFERAAWICVQLGVQLLRAAARERPEWIADESLFEELRAMMRGYFGLAQSEREAG